MQAPAPSINHRSVPQLGRFEEVTSHEVNALLRAAPNKQCSADFAPTWLVKQMGDGLAPVITDMINKSFEDGCFPSSQKEAIVRRRLKKSSLDPTDLTSFRPILNLSFISKLIERAATNRFTARASLFQLLPVHHSACRKFHSTETAILLDVLSFRFGVTDRAYEWFSSYLTGRTQVISTNTCTSQAVALTCGVRQGSVVGPHKFTAYTEDMEERIESFNVKDHLYAEDIQGLTHAYFANFNVANQI